MEWKKFYKWPRGEIVVSLAIKQISNDLRFSLVASPANSNNNSTVYEHFKNSLFLFTQAESCFHLFSRKQFKPTIYRKKISVKRSNSFRWFTIPTIRVQVKTESSIQFSLAFDSVCFLGDCFLRNVSIFHFSCLFIAIIIHTLYDCRGFFSPRQIIVYLVLSQVKVFSLKKQIDSLPIKWNCRLDVAFFHLNGLIFGQFI